MRVGQSARRDRLSDASFLERRSEVPQDVVASVGSEHGNGDGEVLGVVCDGRFIRDLANRDDKLRYTRELSLVPEPKGDRGAGLVDILIASVTAIYMGNSRKGPRAVSTHPVVGVAQRDRLDIDRTRTRLLIRHQHLGIHKLLPRRLLGERGVPHRFRHVVPGIGPSDPWGRVDERRSVVVLRLVVGNPRLPEKVPLPVADEPGVRRLEPGRGGRAHSVKVTRRVPVPFPAAGVDGSRVDEVEQAGFERVELVGPIVV